MLQVFLVSMLLLVCNTLYGESLTGLQVVERAKQNASGFVDLTQQIRMILMDENGEHIERDMLVKALAGADGQSYSLSIFTAPKREKGIALLTVSEAKGNDKQYLYLPSTRRTKRITSSNRSSSFRGSEFSFEDLSEQHSKDYRFQLVKKAPCGDLDCFVVDRFPNPGLESSYSKAQLWIDATHFRPMKAIYYDQKGSLLKTMEASGYSLFEDQYWNPKQVLMVNHQTGKSTEMQSLNLSINTGLKASEFTELAIRSWR